MRSARHRCALALVLALAACGGGPSTPAEPPAPAAPAITEALVDGEIVGAIAGAPEAVTLAHSGGSFAIDAFEASLVDGRAVSVAGATPAANLSWYAARDACAAAGRRLCSEEEWLVACTGAQPVDRDRDGRFSDDPIPGRAHPYGDQPDATFCAASRQRTDPRPLITGNHPRCVTPEGVYDLEGVTKEWIGLTPDKAAVKGGSYYSIGSARCGYFKENLAPDAGDPSVGFRCCSGDPPASSESALPEGGRVGDVLEDWSLPVLDGGTFGTAQLEGRPFVLTFWASYCGPCRNELPAIAGFWEQYRAQGLEVVAVNVDTDIDAARAFMRTTPIPFHVVLDGDNAIRNRFGARTLPTTFFVTKTGRIRQRTTGYDQRFHAELGANIAALMTAE